MQFRHIDAMTFLFVSSLAALQMLALSPACGAEEPGFPRIMAIAIGIPAYYDRPATQQNLSKADVLIMQFWPGWRQETYGRRAISRAVQSIRARHPGIMIGHYTILNEAKGSESTNRADIDVARKLDRESWWLTNAGGRRQQHTSRYDAWDVNSTSYTKPDASGDRYPQWLARRNFKTFFEYADFDFWFLDNSLVKSPVSRADWNRDGEDDSASQPEMARAYREGHVAYWNAIRALQPTTLLIGNAPDLSAAEYQGKLNGSLLEAAMGRHWSVYEREGWKAMRRRYFDLFEHTTQPHLVGFNVWGKPDDYRQMRFGLASCLLHDGYFSFTNVDTGYAEIPWFEEFDTDLGRPTTPPPRKAWQNGVYRRDYAQGIVLVNPSDTSRTIEVGPGYRRLRGNQDPETNSGAPAHTVTLPPEDGLLLLRAASY